MPAVELSRLKLQAGKLRDDYSQPPAFVRRLKDLLEFYGSRAQRAGQSGTPPTILHTYNTPPPVLRQVLVEISPLVSEDPEPALPLMDALWEQPNLECRLLAVSLLGLYPVSPPEPVLDRFQAWMQEAEERVAAALMDRGLQRFRREDPQALFRLVRRWITSENPHDQRLGLRTLTVGVSGDAVDDLPVLFSLITPLVRSPSPPLRQEVAALLAAFARLSPAETAFLLKENLDFPGTPWLARRVLPSFPPTQQESLKASLRRIARRE
jgi:hypothetical protein